jgi:diguanylate cyclase (GGDEF)-like protein/PAS domain S-box-containing protein
MDLLPNSIIHDHPLKQFFAQTETIAVQGFDQFMCVTYWNLASEKLYGISAEQALGKKIDQLIIPKQLILSYQQNCETWFNQKAPIAAREWSLNHYNGHSIELLSNHVLSQSSQEHYEIYKIDIDLSKQKRLESLVHHDQALMSSIFNALPDLFLLMDSKGVICAYYSAEKNDFPRSSLTYVGKTPSMIFSREIANLFDETRIAALESGQVETFEYQIKVENEAKFFEARLIALDDASQLVVIIRDISEQKITENALVNRDKLYRQFFEKNKAIKLVINPINGNIIDANEAALLFYGYSFKQITTMSISDINTLSEEEVFSEMQKAKLEQRLFFKFKHRLASAEIKDVEVFSGPIEMDDKTLIYSIIQDVSQRHIAERALRSKEQQLRDLLNHATAVIYMKDLQGKYICINKRCEDIFNLQEHEIVNKTDFDLFPSHVAKQLQRNDQRVIASRKAIETEEVVDLKSVERIYHAVKYPLIDEQGNIYAICGISTDITERKVAEQKMFHQAHFDTLTNLPNRLLALDRLSQLLEEAKRNDEHVAVLFLDLDDFKKINDSLGHDVGDKLLLQASNRLTSVVRTKDTVGRLGGDEFIVLLGGLSQGSDASHVIEGLLNQFRQAFIIEGRQLILTASIGIAVFPEDGHSSADLLRCADTAMYQAKYIGRNTHCYFTASMNTDISRRLELEEQMRGALERNEFEVYYQPQYDLLSMRVIGAEALLRWYNPTLGHVSPAEFIPIAEHTGLIVPIGQFVFLQAIKTLVTWQGNYQHELRMAINLSPRQFRDPLLVHFIESALLSAKVAPKFIELEITEGVLMSGHTYIKDALKELHQLGIALSMDDFGTGYSSLSYLREYPFSILKIDRCFVDGLGQGDADRELVIATIAMAHALGLKVVAEGIETRDQLLILQDLRCDFGQGYLMGKPMNELKLLSSSQDTVQNCMVNSLA